MHPFFVENSTVAVEKKTFDMSFAPPWALPDTTQPASLDADDHETSTTLTSGSFSVRNGTGDENEVFSASATSLNEPVSARDLWRVVVSGGGVHLLWCGVQKHRHCGAFRCDPHGS